MSLTATVGQNKSEKLSGKIYGGIILTIYVIAAAAATALAQSDVVLSNLNINVKMSRGDIKDHQIINASLDSVGPAAAYQTAEWKHFDPGATTNGNYDVLVANAIGVAEIG